jgi:hypothetical protein
MIALNPDNFSPTKVKLTNACKRRLCRSGSLSSRALLLKLVGLTGDAYFHNSIYAKVYWYSHDYDCSSTCFEYRDLEEVK